MIHTANATINHCRHCGYTEEAAGRFCGNCGTPNYPPIQPAFVHAPRQDQIGPPPNPHFAPNDPTAAITEVLPANFPGNPNRPVVPLNDRQVPSFAHVQASVTPDISSELKKEAAKIIVLLARERLFLYFHWAVFIGLNLLGVWLALRCYFEFIGDEMTKSMIASTPFLFINSVALCCLVSIKGTRREIARLKEQAQFVKFKMEFGHLM